MALILNLETATTNCSVSLGLDGQPIGLKEDRSHNYSHAELLHVFIDDLIAKSDFSKSEIDAIAVSKGPGSYTGLRIGVSAAKGLAYAWDIPLISISTLESLAHQVEVEEGIIVPMLDARRLEVYSAIFDSNYQLLRAIEAEILSETSYHKQLEESVVHFIGNGVEKTSSLIKHSNARFIFDAAPSAEQMCALSDVKYKKNDIEDVAYFEPFYLKNFVGTISKKN